MQNFTSSIIGLLLIFSSIPSGVQAQTEASPNRNDTFILSSDENFTADERLYDNTDVLYMMIKSERLDFTGIQVNEYRLISPAEDTNTDRVVFEGSFENNFDGSYIGKFDLSELPADIHRWVWQGHLEDDKGQVLEVRAQIGVGVENQPIEVEVRGVLQEVTETTLTLYGRTMDVTDESALYGVNGEPITITDLEAGMAVETLVLVDGETYTVLKLQVIERDPREEIEVKGAIERIGDRELMVEGVVFSISDDTKILDENNEPIRFDALAEGDLVAVLGQFQEDGSILALLVKKGNRDRGDFMVEGEIEEILDRGLVLQETLFIYTENTIILDPTGQQIRFEDLEVGLMVAVRAQLGADGLPYLIKVQVLENSGFLVHAEGELEQIIDRTLVVQGKKFFVTDNTRIVDSNGEPVGFNGLVEGMYVQVVGRYTTDQFLEAILVEVRGENEQIISRGLIEKLGDRGLVVRGAFYQVIDATVILDEAGQELGYEDLVVGQAVVIYAKRNAEGSLVAARIEVTRSLLVIDGRIEEVLDRAIIVGDFKFAITENTEILSANGGAVDFTDLEVGQLVIVEAFPVSSADPGADDMYRARRILIVDDQRDEFRVSGEIQEVGERVFVLEDYEFDVSEETRFVDVNGNEVTFDYLQEGMKVVVYAIKTDDGYLALGVKELPERPIHISGRIEQLEGNRAVVGDVAFTMTEDTEIFDAKGNSLNIEDLRVGMRIRAALIENNTDGFVATHVQVIPRIEDEVWVTGVIEAKTEGSLVVLGRTFRVFDRTKIVGADGSELGMDALSVGRSVRIRADLLAGDALVALKITLLEEGIAGIHVVGPVESVDATTLQVVGIYFFIDADTRVFDLDGNALPANQLPVGETVEVRAVGLENGTQRAVNVQVQEVVVAAGTVAEWDGAGLSILGSTFTIDASALVLASDNGHLNLDAIKDGQFVEIRGISAVGSGKQGNASLSVTKIKLLDATTNVSNETETSGQVPSSFILEQNYPNPFNPETTIRFSLSEAGPVRLAIYNLLGQEVYQFSYAQLQPGEHQVSWRGTDQFGNTVSSGVYLYRMEVGSEVQTRQMVFMK